MIFNFGKYKYQELSYVVENDLDYALWVLRSVNKLEKDDLCVLKKLTQEKLFSMLDMFVDAVTEAILDVLIIENIWGCA
tara:strand:+ start:809 stop:1045 length:237 start_codon:yes stop_codon:yes gene_type:complete